MNLVDWKTTPTPTMTGENFRDFCAGMAMHNFSPEQIMNALGVSRRTYFRYRKHGAPGAVHLACQLLFMRCCDIDAKETAIRQLRQLVAADTENAPEALVKALGLDGDNPTLQ